MSFQEGGDYRMPDLAGRKHVPEETTTDSPPSPHSGVAAPDFARAFDLIGRVIRNLDRWEKDGHLELRFGDPDGPSPQSDLREARTIAESLLREQQQEIARLLQENARQAIEVQASRETLAETGAMYERRLAMEIAPYRESSRHKPADRAIKQATGPGEPSEPDARDILLALLLEAPDNKVVVTDQVATRMDRDRALLRWRDYENNTTVFQLAPLPSREPSPS